MQYSDEQQSGATANHPVQGLATVLALQSPDAQRPPAAPIPMQRRCLYSGYSFVDARHPKHILINLGHHCNTQDKLDIAHEAVCQSLNAGEAILVHCKAGKHRAPMLVLYLLMFIFGYGLEQGIAHLNKHRPCVEIKQFLSRSNKRTKVGRSHGGMAGKTTGNQRRPLVYSNI